jgi:hypothetical protein
MGDGSTARLGCILRCMFQFTCQIEMESKPKYLRSAFGIGIRRPRMHYYMGAYTPNELKAMEEREKTDPTFRTYWYGGSIRVTAPLCDHVNQYRRKEESLRIPSWALMIQSAWWLTETTKGRYLDESNQYVLSSIRERIEPRYKKTYRAFRHLMRDCLMIEELNLATGDHVHRRA